MVDTIDIAGLVHWGASQLEAVSTSPRLDAEILLARVLGADRSHLRAWPEKAVAPLQRSEFEVLVQHRARGAPVAYLTGEREFWSLSLRVTPDTLVPRPETETLVATALGLLDDRHTLRVADLGTGSGAIALALASERPDWRIIATDICPAALRVARENATSLNLMQVDFRQGHWCQALTGLGELDAILSNPPYVAVTDPHLLTLHEEPQQALAAGEDGLDAIRELLAEAPVRLCQNGWLLLEHGAQQGPAVRELMESAGFSAVHTTRDDSGLERVTGGRRPAPHRTSA